MRLDWCVVGSLVEVGIGSKYRRKPGVENPGSEAFCKRRRGDTVSILAHNVTHVHLGQKLRGSRLEDAATIDEVTMSLTYELGSEHYLHAMETPS
ncbi:hypothetical protein Sjap_002754 [Stephania japonica]|uniref:Uncharacterized protein n=1 Tax=Stephania japonica TaxID=461633 RepID=A0AAP0PUU1_9MAGN